MDKNQLTQLSEVLSHSNEIVILQADNPDADSLASALALESMLEEQGKQVRLYCAVDMPNYLKYMQGWSRVTNELPAKFDLSIVVDASAMTLFERSVESGSFKWISTKPCIVLDHHAQTANDISFAKHIINEPSLSSTCELIYQIADHLGWQVPADALAYIANGILGDTQGLSNQLASSKTYRVMAELIERGVNRADIEEARREYSKMPENIYRFKAKLIMQTEFAADGRIAYATVNQQEINTYSPLYNPGPLIQSDMLQVEGVRIGIVFKIYDNGTVTAMIRANNGAEIADKLAAHFGGGGHAYASGFKINNGQTFSKIKADCLSKAQDLLDGTR